MFIVIHGMDLGSGDGSVLGAACDIEVDSDHGQMVGIGYKSLK